MKQLITRKIAYSTKEENFKQQASYALTLTIKERMKLYYQLIKANYAMAGYDIDKLRVKRIIYYEDDLILLKKAAAKGRTKARDK